MANETMRIFFPLKIFTYPQYDCMEDEREDISPREAVKYEDIEMQKDYQHKVMICDRDDFCVFEMLDGKVTHPLPETLQGEQPEQGGMELKL